MKKILKVFKPLIGFFLAAVVLFSGAASFSAEQIMLTTHDLPPYGTYQPDGNFDGLAIKPVRYALEKMGWSYEIRVVPWERAQAMVVNGVADGFFAASKSEERESFAVLSAIIADQKWNWYWPKEKALDPFSAEFKKNVRVASFHGANMQKWLKEEGYRVTAEPNDTDHAITLLLADRFDALLANNHVAGQLIAQRDLQDRFAIATQQDKPLGVYFSKRFLSQHPSFLEIFNQHIKDYKQAHNLLY